MTKETLGIIILCASVSLVVGWATCYCIADNGGRIKVKHVPWLIFGFAFILCLFVEFGYRLIQNNKFWNKTLYKL